MEQKKIVVVGSTNMDMVIKTSHIPVPGETVLAESFFMNPGGKGANQAVTIARLGGRVSFISKVGNDVFGKQSAQLFDEEGIDTRYFLSDNELPSGVALITVDRDGENSIVVASGANSNLFPADLQDTLNEIGEADIVLLQLEIPLETVEFVAKYAASKKVKVILDPAPAHELSTKILSFIDIITPNKTEAERLSGIKIDDIENAKDAAQAIHKKGARDVIITLGASGVVICQEGKIQALPSPKVEALDTTAAGDAFNGALAVAMSEGKNFEASVEFACKVAAICVTRMGAQSSLPYRNEFIAEML